MHASDKKIQINAAQGKILGRRETSLYGIRKNDASSVKQGAASAIKNAAAKVSPRELIRNTVKAVRIAEFVNTLSSEDLSGKVEIVGKKGVNLLVGLAGMIIRKMTRAAGALLLWAMGIIAPYILIFSAGFIILIITCQGGMQNAYASRSADRVGAYAASSLAEPRISGSDENTLSILANAWYFGNNPFYNAGYGMPNCTCYAWGRRAEITGEAPKLPTGNAGSWYEANIRSGAYAYGQEPQVGAVAVWKYPGTRDSGHVAVVEVINEDGSFICSNSAWQSTFFYVQTWTMDSIRNWSHRNAVFQGFIYMDPANE